MGKGEIARNEQFLLFPQCFQKACFPRESKGVIVWEWVNSLTHNPDTIQYKHLNKKAFQNIVRKREMLLAGTMFSTHCMHKVQL